jgi:hypothetical protein
MIKFAPSEIGDFQRITGEETEFDPKRDTHECYTVWEDNEPYAMYGATVISQGHGRCFFVCKDEVRDRPLTMTKLAKWFLEESKDQYRRLDATVRVDFPEGLRWAEMLGFEVEGVMKDYDPKDGCSHLILRLRKD